MISKMGDSYAVFIILFLEFNGCTFQGAAISN